LGPRTRACLLGTSRRWQDFLGACDSHRLISTLALLVISVGLGIGVFYTAPDDAGVEAEVTKFKAQSQGCGALATDEDPLACYKSLSESLLEALEDVSPPTRAIYSNYAIPFILVVYLPVTLFITKFTSRLWKDCCAWAIPLTIFSEIVPLYLAFRDPLRWGHDLLLHSFGAFATTTLLVGLFWLMEFITECQAESEGRNKKEYSKGVSRGLLSVLWSLENSGHFAEVLQVAPNYGLSQRVVIYGDLKSGDVWRLVHHDVPNWLKEQLAPFNCEFLTHTGRECLCGALNMQLPPEQQKQTPGALRRHVSEWALNNLGLVEGDGRYWTEEDVHLDDWFVHAVSQCFNIPIAVYHPYVCAEASPRVFGNDDGAPQLYRIAAFGGTYYALGNVTRPSGDNEA